MPCHFPGRDRIDRRRFFLPLRSPLHASHAHTRCSAAAIRLPIAATCLIIATDLKTADSMVAAAMRGRSRFRFFAAVFCVAAAIEMQTCRWQLVRFDANSFRAAHPEKKSEPIERARSTPTMRAKLLDDRAYVSWRA